MQIGMICKWGSIMRCHNKKQVNGYLIKWMVYKAWFEFNVNSSQHRRSGYLEYED